jgi:hypothetical protein
MNETPAFDVSRLRRDDEVSVNSPKWPGVWIVEKVNQVSVSLTKKNGTTRLKAHKSLLIAPTENISLGRPFKLRELRSLRPGEFVRYDGNSRAEAGLYVVVADKGERVNIAPLGGMPDPRYTYWRVMPQNLRLVSLTDVIVELTGSAPVGGKPNLSLVPPITPADENKRIAAGQHSHCTGCGYEFPRPQFKATCNSKPACDRRKTARAAAGAR